MESTFNVVKPNAESIKEIQKKISEIEGVILRKAFLKQLDSINQSLEKINSNNEKKMKE
jgi:hypothetical protein